MLVLITDLVFALLSFLSAILLAWFIIGQMKKRNFNKLKTKLSQQYKYNCYYLKENDLKKDPAAIKLSSISYPGYVDAAYGKFYKNLTVEHLPITVLINWTRTIAEDIISSVSPVNHVASWSDYFHSQEYKYYASSSVHPDLIEFEEHELAYLWGAVYYWLKCVVVDYNNEEVFNHIETVAIRKDFLRPYFYHYKRLATGMDAISDDKSESVMSPKGELTAEQTALLWLAIATLTEENVTKKSLAPAISRVTGVGVQSLKSKIVGSFKERDKEVVSSIFADTLKSATYRV